LISPSSHGRTLRHLMSFPFSFLMYISFTWWEQSCSKFNHMPLRWFTLLQAESICTSPLMWKLSNQPGGLCMVSIYVVNWIIIWLEDFIRKWKQPYNLSMYYHVNCDAIKKQEQLHVHNHGHVGKNDALTSSHGPA
jgi:hypothetical protein